MDLLTILKSLRADLFYQIESKHGAEKASKYPSIVSSDSFTLWSTEPPVPTDPNNLVTLTAYDENVEKDYNVTDFHLLKVLKDNGKYELEWGYYVPELKLWLDESAFEIYDVESWYNPKELLEWK